MIRTTKQHESFTDLWERLDNSGLNMEDVVFLYVDERGRFRALFEIEVPSEN